MEAYRRSSAVLRSESCNRLPGGNLVLALDQAAGIVPSGYVTEPNVARQGAEERNSVSNEHGNTCDYEALNEPSPKKPLNGDPAINVNMADAANGKLRHDFGRIPRHTLYRSPGRRWGKCARAEHENRLLTIRPSVKAQDRLEGFAPYDKRIHGGHELIIAVGFATAGWQPIEVTIGSCDEAVDTSANKN
jgi:hypothetical protein